MGWTRWLLVVPLLTACAGRLDSSPAPGADRMPDPARIYSVGEEHFAAGRYPEAVTLWRHAILEMPSTPAYDDVRHQLVLRLGHGQLMAWHVTGNPGFLEDAQQMLERYADRHASIFGEDQAAVKKRDEVYELLSEVEFRLDPPEYAEQLEPTTDDPILALASEANEMAAEAEPLPEVHEDYVEDGEYRRTVIVQRERTTVDDPRMRALLESDFTDPFILGGVLTRPGLEMVHGPRPLLRAGGIARPVASEGEQPSGARRRARTLGRSLLAEARPALASCYEAAYARRPVDLARSTVEVEVDAEGRVREATIVEGGLVDTLGDLCLVEQLESMRLPTTVADDDTRIRVPMTFFYEGPVFINEGTGRSAPAHVLDVVDAVPGDPTKRPPPRSAVDSGEMSA